MNRIMGCSFLSSQCKPTDPVGKLLRKHPRDPSTSLGMTGKVAPDQMARKAQAVAYWLVPETAARAVLSREIRVLARRFGAPLFEPHVTIFVAPESSRPPRDVLCNLPPVKIELTIRSIRFGEHVTKTLFVEFETSRT